MPHDADHEVVVAPPVFTVLTVVSTYPEPEYRRYEVSSDELHLFLSEVEHEADGERVVKVTEGENDDLDSGYGN